MTARYSTGLVNAILSGSSLKQAIEGSTGFFVDLYTGSRPSSPDLAATGTRLVTYSVGGTGSGCHMAATAAARALSKDSSETWSGTGLAAGTAGYFRLRTGTDTGATDSTTAIRIDGTVATSGGDLNMSPSTTIAVGAPQSLTPFDINYPNV